MRWLPVVSSTTRRESRDAGMSLVEVMVSMFFLSVIAAVVATVTISGLKLTTSIESGVQSRNEINDAIARMSRDIAAADPILVTSPQDGWERSTPAADELWLQGFSGGKCVRTRYYVNTVSGSLDVDVRLYDTDDCPDPRLPDTSGQLVTRTLVHNLATDDADHDDDDGNSVSGEAFADVFTYHSRENTEMSVPISRGAVSNIARVTIDVGAKVRDRKHGVELSASVVPRAMDQPLVTGIPAPRCTDAALTVTSDGLAPATPVITWSETRNAETFVLNRTTVAPQDGLVMRSDPPPPSGFLDSAVRGWWGQPITYTLDITGAAGTVQCPVDYTPPTPAPLGAPLLDARVNPQTASVPETFPQSDIDLTWGAAPRATAYNVYRRPIDPNTSPYPPMDPAWALVGTTTSRSYKQSPGFDQAFEYRMEAVSTDYTPALVSELSNPVKTLTHTRIEQFTGIVLLPGINRLTWSTRSSGSADGYAVWRRRTGTTAWVKVWETTDPMALTYTDTDVRVGDRFDYAVSSFNDGPRGTADPVVQRYYGPLADAVTLLNVL